VKYCEECHEYYPNQSNFCRSCGKKLQFEEERQNGPEQDNHIESSTSALAKASLNHDEYIDQIENKEKKRKTALLVGVLGVILILIILKFANSHSYSYKIGYQAGQDASAQNLFFTMSGQPIDLCNLMVTLSKNGTPTDNIDWQNVNVDEFNQGCMDAYADTHDGLRKKSTPGPVASDSPTTTPDGMTPTPTDGSSAEANQNSLPSDTPTPEQTDATGSIGN
jgi:hypothetical protein